MTRPVELTPARRLLLALLCVALTPSCAAWAVTSPAAARAPLTSSLSGTVVDENEAIVPGARVTVSNHATGLQRQVLTDGDGYSSSRCSRPASTPRGSHSRASPPSRSGT